MAGKSERIGPKGHYINLRIFVPDRAEVRRKSGQKTWGRRSGLGVGAFIATLLKANELLQDRKMTDEVLARQICLEFPDSPCARGILSGTKTVGEWRVAYNRGELTQKQKPEYPSRRYDGLGNVVNPRTGKPITPAEREKWSKKYGFTY